MASNGRRVCPTRERGKMFWKGLNNENHSSVSPGYQTPGSLEIRLTSSRSLLNMQV